MSTPDGSPDVTIVGAGLAGCEAALQLAARGLSVRMLEQKPQFRTPAQSSDQLCELVCSNSFRGAALSNAVGLLKEEMRRLGSFVMRAADETRVPAGGALAVDRERFAARMTQQLRDCPGVELVSSRVDRLPKERPLLVATGPLTGDELAQDLAHCIGAEQIAYYDAIAPIVSAESIDWDRVFLASRWDKGETEEERSAYANCPLDQAQYEEFVSSLKSAVQVKPKSFEKARYFEGCLPIEVMAERGERTLAFGPMKPVGLTDPRTGRWPHAVVQLRSEDVARSAYNLVGFQTRLTWPEQKRIFRNIPGLERAEFVRYGAVHRNTFVNSPRVLESDMSLCADRGVFLAGQITGTEGYVESAASGWLSAYFIAGNLAGKQRVPPPPTTAHAGLLLQLSKPSDDYQPSNITFAHLAPWQGERLKKRAKYDAMSQLALRQLRGWAEANDVSFRADAGSVSAEVSAEAAPSDSEVHVATGTGSEHC